MSSGGGQKKRIEGERMQRRIELKCGTIEKQEIRVWRERHVIYTGDAEAMKTDKEKNQLHSHSGFGRLLLCCLLHFRAANNGSL